MKKLPAILLAIGMMLAMSGCSRKLIDTTYNYTYAYVLLPNGECVEGKVQPWKYRINGNQIQVVIDGVTYFTDTTRVVLTTK